MSTRRIQSDGTYRRLAEQWAAACDEWLPIASEDSIWRFSRAMPQDLPAQGWKLHVSATVLSAYDVLAAVAPELHRYRTLFKAPSTLVELRKLNCGLFYGYTQIGKFITVYPRSDAEAIRLARTLHTLTSSFVAPSVPFELPVDTKSSVFTRFGAFGPSSTVRAPTGESVEDRRDRNPDWVDAPNELVLHKCGRSRRGPLATRYRAFGALTQRGKGGVYAAVDLTDPSGRLCVLKEGRRAGEVDWDGSDGRRRAHHEARVLRDLQHTAVRPPQVYGLFSQDGHSYLALELIAGSPLTELVEPTAEPLELSRAMTVGRQCAALLSRIHDQNWVWRDMKPSNIMVTNGELRPLDFEGAARVGSVASAPWGSPGYAPPEWLTATRIWPSQDLYALGVVLLQLFTGTPPQPGQPSPDVRTIRPEVPDQVAKIISRLTSQRPEDRGTAADAVSCLALDLP